MIEDDDEQTHCSLCGCSADDTQVDEFEWGANGFFVHVCTDCWENFLEELSQGKYDMMFGAVK